MVKVQSSVAAICKYCGRPLTHRRRQFLNLDALCMHELPPHVDLGDRDGEIKLTLAEFLSEVITDAYQVDFDDHTWSHHGRYPSSGSGIVVSMSASKPSSGSPPDKDVRIAVDQRVKGKDKGSSAFLARRSMHSELDVEYLELDAALSQDHCRKEAEYDPSIFHGNRLFEWNAEDLKEAVQTLNPEWRVQSIQMSGE